MHEDYLQIVRDVFSAYTDAEITDTTLKDFLMQVSFTFRGFALKLNIVHPENAYLREVLVCIEDEVANVGIFRIKIVVNMLLFLMTYL